MTESLPPSRTPGLDASRSAETPPLTWPELRLVCAFWAIFAIVGVANRAVALGEWSGRDLWAAGVVALVESALWAALTALLFRQAERGGPASAAHPSTARWLVALALPVAVGMAVVGAYLRLWLDLFPPNVDREVDIRAAVGFGFFMTLVIYGAIAAAALARAYSRRYRAREAHAARLEAQLASAQLDALRRQLDPHFLFNTLNLISSLADTDPRGVRRMIARLSELLRFSLEGAGAAEVPLRRELALLERYLDIVRMRFAGRLEVETRTCDEALDAMVPSLILQPLVENAVKHGVEKLRGPARVAIEALCEGEVLVLRVRDNGPAWDRAPDENAGGVGVRNTVARLRQLYGGAARFTLAEAEGGGTVAEVRLPLRAPAVLRTRAVSDAEEGAEQGGVRVG